MSVLVLKISWFRNVQSSSVCLSKAQEISKKSALQKNPKNQKIQTDPPSMIASLNDLAKNLALNQTQKDQHTQSRLFCCVDRFEIGSSATDESIHLTNGFFLGVKT
jgi:hypothetical protein